MTTPVQFLRETKDELSKVIWPKRQEVIRLTSVVIFLSFIVGIYIGGLDYLFSKVIQFVLK